MNNKSGVLLPLTLIIILIVVLFNLNKITDYTSQLISPTPKATISKPNEYYFDNDYIFVQKSKDFIPYSMQDIINIFYSILDNGYESFTFYCPSEYPECINDVNSIINNRALITDIGNFVHPFNSFNTLDVTTGSLGEVNIIVNRVYNEEMIMSINDRLDKIFKQVLTDEMDINDKILALHDYIIDTTSYDLETHENSGNAYGLLFDGKAKCAGYADVMAIMLSKLGVKNFKVATTQHVWNALYLDDEWYQIDLTWDDPIVENGTKVTDTIRHKFYMIDTDTLQSYDTKEHNFDFATYPELKPKLKEE